MLSFVNGCVAEASQSQISICFGPLPRPLNPPGRRNAGKHPCPSNGPRPPAAWRRQERRSLACVVGRPLPLELTVHGCVARPRHQPHVSAARDQHPPLGIAPGIVKEPHQLPVGRAHRRHHPAAVRRLPCGVVAVHADRPKAEGLSSSSRRPHAPRRPQQQVRDRARRPTHPDPHPGGRTMAHAPASSRHMCARNADRVTISVVLPPHHPPTRELAP